MRTRANLLMRGLLMSFVALGLMSMGGVSVSAQTVVCQPNPLLAGADGDNNGTVTIDEIRALAANENVSESSSARLLEVANDAEGRGLAGIKYRDCTPGETATATTAPGETATATTAPGETATATTAPGETATATTAPGQTPATGDDGDTGVDQDAGDGTDQDVDTGDDGTDVDQDAGAGDGTDNGVGDDNGDVTAPGAGDDTDGVTDLPETGVGEAGESNTQSMLMLGVGSLLVAAGAFAFRTKKA